MRNRRAVAITSVACALAALMPAPCFAQADALTDKAATLYDEGMAAYSKSKWAEARASFLAAWALKNHWQIAGSLGDCELRLGFYRDAAAHLSYYLRLAPSGKPKTDAARVFDTARAKVSTLVLAVDVPSADIAVDGTVVGKAPLPDPLFVEPGHHRIEARSGVMIASIQVDVAAGEKRDIVLAPTAPVVPVAGPRGPGWGWVIASGVIGVGGLAVGAGLTVAANGKASDSAALRAMVGGSSACTIGPMSSACSALGSTISSRDALSNGAVAAFVVGGAFTLATVGLGAWQGASRTATTGMRVVPLAGPSVGGVAVTGAW